jgi:hypothetical protein
MENKLVSCGYDVNWEFLWHHIAMWLDIRTCFLHFARTCKMFRSLSLTDGVCRALVQNHIPDDHYLFLRIREQWMTILKRWALFQNVLKKNILSLVNQNRYKIATTFNRNQLRFGECSWCDRTCYEFYAVRGTIVCCHPPVGNRHQFNEGTIYLDTIEHQFGPMAETEAKKSGLAWKHTTNELMMTMEDLKYVIQTRLSDEELQLQLKRWLAQLDTRQQESWQRSKRKRTIEKDINGILRKTRQKLNQRYETTIPCNGTFTFQVANAMKNGLCEVTNAIDELPPTIPTCNNIYHNIQSDLSVALFNIELEQIRVRKLDEDYRALCRKNGTSKFFRQMRGFWLDMMGARGLLQCTATLRNGKHNCSHQTDGISNLCRRHKTLLQSN